METFRRTLAISLRLTTRVGGYAGHRRSGEPGLTEASRASLDSAQPISAAGNRSSCLTGDTVARMANVSVRDLRNHGGDVLQRVSQGEILTVTHAGQAIAELRPLRRRRLTAAALVDRRHHLTLVDQGALRADIDSVIDPSL